MPSKSLKHMYFQFDMVGEQNERMPPFLRKEAVLDGFLVASFVLIRVMRVFC